MASWKPFVGPLITEVIGLLGQGAQPAQSGFGISEFMENIGQNDEVAFTDMFNVFIPLPPGVDNGYGTHELALTCEAAEFPGIDIQTTQYRHHAFTRYLPRTLQYGQLSLTFYVVGGMREKMVFDDWTNAMINFSGNGTGLIQYRQDVTGMRNYESDITINQYDRAGNLTYWARAIDAFPVSVNAMNVNWSDNSPHRITVNFAYTKWLTDAHNPDGASIEPVVTNYTNQLQQQIGVTAQNVLGHIPTINPFLKLKI